MSQASIAIPPFVTESEAKFYLSMKLFEIGRLSCGQAAELAGYTKRTYMELLGRQGVAVIDYPASELQDDLGNA
jgi:predicted HTH domain antitoxin